MNEQASRRIELGDLPPVSVFGQNDANLRIIRDLYGARVVARGTEILLDGPPAEVGALGEIFDHLMSVARQGRWVSPSDVRYAIRMVRNENGQALSVLNGDAPTLRPFHGLRKEIGPKTVNQAEYLGAIEDGDIVFAIGPAGTGKTYLAMAAALSALNRREIDRIHLVRPAVDAGESLGFLPGDFTEKVAPYLRPLYDALNDMMPLDRVQKLLDSETIEVAPLAYMRGRTLNNSVVILDEAQNTTLPQMRMLLTRLGNNSKAIITGDDTQIDLPKREDSALLKIRYVLRSIEGIRFVRFGGEDVVRHHLVQEIIQAFDDYDGRNERGGKPSAAPKGGERK
ncbi:MAG: phosphate starvation protein PhoH [Gemmatimonadota bacterium]|nr:MAG: phosphate starvation protein PhoH [Gemmatimonadota bacterium]